jgi:peptidoglycan hydrolase-like protein with peptidoglycan-binding domain
MPALQIGATGADVKRLQKALNAAGFNCGTPDGAFGPGTQAAVKAFQSALDPVIAARILAQFLKRAETMIRFALAGQDLTSAREAVNGGTYGLAEFAAAFHRGKTIF